MTIRGRAIILCLLMCSGRAIYAEDAPAPSLGTRARLTIAGDSERVVGTITSVDETALTIQPPGREPIVVARKAILRLEESKKPSRKHRGAWIGFGIGLSASVGKVAMQGGCNDGCNGDNLLIGGLVAASAAVVGALVSSGEQWQDLAPLTHAWQAQTTRPRLQLVPSIGRGAGLRVVASF